MGKEFGSFRKAAFGGFNRKDVIDYIEKMRNESFEYKKQVDETVRSLNEKIRELENAARFIESPATPETVPDAEVPAVQDFGDIGVATKHLKTVADELCRSLGDFIERLNENGLFENAEEPVCCNEETEDPVIEEEPSLVDGILSSISYLGDASDKKEAKEKACAEISVSDLLSGLSFAN